MMEAYKNIKIFMVIYNNSRPFRGWKPLPQRKGEGEKACGSGFQPRYIFLRWVIHPLATGQD
jgi:hypothetical protein